MPAPASQAYLRTKVLTANPVELRLLLLDGAIRFAKQAKDGYERRDFEASYEGTSKCQAILTELMCGLRPEHDPQLCSRLSALYTFLLRRLIDAGLEKSGAIVQEVLGLLEYERETWSMLLDRIAQQSAEPAAEPAAGVSLRG
jgi:flagellar protein FliS